MTSPDSDAILRAIEEELQRLRKIRSLLAGEPAHADWQADGRARPGKRNLSAEARQRIVDAQKRRWASRKANA